MAADQTGLFHYYEFNLDFRMRGGLSIQRTRTTFTIRREQLGFRKSKTTGNPNSRRLCLKEALPGLPVETLFRSVCLSQRDVELFLVHGRVALDGDDAAQIGFDLNQHIAFR